MSDVAERVLIKWRVLLHTIWKWAPNQTEAEPYIAMLEHYSQDEEIHPGVPGSNWWLGMKRAPAARKNHHDRIGGLVEHILQMFDVYMRMADVYPQLKHPVFLSPWDVLRAIIHHDLHKGHRYYMVINPQDEQMQGIELYKDEVGMMLTDDQRTLQMLLNFDIKLTPLLLNTLFWSEGGWSENNAVRARPARPVLAVLAYLLDELSGNVLERINKEDWTCVGTARRNRPR